MPNPTVVLPYTYFAAWYVMYCPSLMTAVQISEDFVPFVQKLECSSWQGLYMYVIRRTIQNSVHYHLVRCFLDFPGASYGERFLTAPVQIGSLPFSLEYSVGSSTSDLVTWCFVRGMSVRSSPICQADLPANMDVINSISEIQISMATCLKGYGRGASMWPEARVQH